MAYDTVIVKEPPKTKEKRIMIVGMPGIGSVGKMSIEYMIDVLKPSLCAQITSRRMPAFSYIDTNNNMKLPEILLYQKKMGQRRIFFLSGDYQPLSEEDIFDFCDEIIELSVMLGIKEIVCTGGIGLSAMPKDPEIYAVSSMPIPKKIVSIGAKTKAHGIISTVSGVTGMLPVLAPTQGITSYALLVETIGIPDSISLKSARNLLHFMTKAYQLKINLKRLDEELKTSTKISELEKLPKGGVIKDETSYIG